MTGCQSQVEKITTTEPTLSTPVQNQNAPWDSNNTMQDGTYVYTLPYDVGTSHVVGQGYNSVLTHFGYMAYALDFLTEEGENVLAARDGVVVNVVDNFNKGCPEPECVAFTNSILIQHSDGTFGNYAHHQYKGARVKVGDTVKVGQVIALAGCTGYCSVSHIHFQVQKPEKGKPYMTVPALFKVDANKAGKIVEEVEYMAPGSEPLKDPTADLPSDSVLRLPARLVKLLENEKDNKKAGEIFLKYMEDNKLKLQNEWKELNRKSFGGDRKIQHQIDVFMNDCYYCMNVRKYPELGRIFDPDPGIVSDDPLGSPETRPDVPKAAWDGLMIYWQLFSL